MSLPSLSGTCSASARNTWPSVSLVSGPAFDWAMVRPSKPMLISTMSLTPFFWHVSNSPFFMRREAFVASALSSPTPSQKIFMPPPVPVLSTTGVLPAPDLPNCSATAVVNGYTVEEPTMRIWSRANAAQANTTMPTDAAVVKVTDLSFTAQLLIWGIIAREEALCHYPLPGAPHTPAPPFYPQAATVL